MKKLIVQLILILVPTIVSAGKVPDYETVAPPDTLGLYLREFEIDLQNTLQKIDELRRDVPFVATVADTYNETAWLTGIYNWGGTSGRSIQVRLRVQIDGNWIEATDYVVYQRNMMLRLAPSRSTYVPKGFGLADQYPEWKRVNLAFGFPRYHDGREFRPSDIQDVVLEILSPPLPTSAGMFR